MTRRRFGYAILGTLGLRFHAYGPGVPVWRGYLEWGGRVVHWVRR